MWSEMTRNEALAIIKEERLKRYVWFEDSPADDSLVIEAPQVLRRSYTGCGSRMRAA